jgi:peroxiredoxin
LKTFATLLAPGAPAAPFDLPLVGGGRIDLDSLLEGTRGALLVFFKTECPTCKLAFPFLQRIWERVPRSVGFGFLAIAQNAASELPGFLAHYGATFPVASESEPYAVSQAYRLTNVPTLFLIDERGIVQSSTVGFSREAYDSLLEATLARIGREPSGSLFTEADAGVPALQPG